MCVSTSGDRHFTRKFGHQSSTIGEKIVFSTMFVSTANTCSCIRLQSLLGHSSHFLPEGENRILHQFLSGSPKQNLPYSLNNGKCSGVILRQDFADFLKISQ